MAQDRTALGQDGKALGQDWTTLGQEGTAYVKIGQCWDKTLAQDGTALGQDRAVLGTKYIFLESSLIGESIGWSFVHFTVTLKCFFVKTGENFRVPADR